MSLVQRRKGASSGDSKDRDKVEYAEANDGLPTTTVEVGGARRPIKLGSCARYIIAGTEWMNLGDRVDGEAPIDCIEGIDGFLLDVVGVWRFTMVNVFGESIEVDACVVDGCIDEFLLGVDFMKAHSAVMDFEKSEVRYSEAERTVILPFQTYEASGGVIIATVRLVQRTKIAASVVMPIAVAVPAADGRQGIFVPTKHTESVIRELGLWIPLEKYMMVFAMNGELDAARLNKWTDALGDSCTPLPNEDEVHVGSKDEKDRALIVKLLRVGDDKLPQKTKLSMTMSNRCLDPELLKKDKELVGFLWRYSKRRMVNTCLVYLDDIVAFTRGGIERHIVELACVLERLSMAGLTLNLKKCIFAMASMEYLGHELSSEGVRPLERIVAAVREFPRPADAAAVKRFVHLPGYYRRFVEEFGSIMALLTTLLRKYVAWQWAEAQEEAFQIIKLLLTTKPVLIYRDFKLPFRVVTDASKVGLGCKTEVAAGSQ
ncbi:unnamed protein product [Phytophthora fragariaefolia]|uniref:Unnamed protein product n=1 Tax=Phytophthora fragariaefolia TaxID=1490495 RepID=A0A9W6Y3N2_9STRA|nr:unnamed protein product [Phytophthora fragariaefolia]